MNLIKCENLSIDYNGKIIFENVSFNIEQGMFLSIVGENGIGKSSLVNSIVGLKKPANGNIIFENGMNREKIGFLPQRHDVNKEFPASVKEIAMSGLLNSGKKFPFFVKKEKETVDNWLKDLGVYDLKKKPFSELSGGQQQRVLIVRALVGAEKILVLDEPASGLDPIASAEMYKTLKKLNQNGITVVMVTHDVETSVEISSHILHLCKGHYYFDKADKYLSSDVCRHFIGIRKGEHKCNH